MTSNLTPRIGIHLFIQKGLSQSLKDAHHLGCQAVQIFSKSPRSWANTPMNQKEITQFKILRSEWGIWPLAIHASYLINLASPKKYLRLKSITALEEELRRAENYGAEYLVVHVGSSSQEMNRNPVLRRVAQSVRQAVQKARPQKTRLLLENMAGERGDIGASFHEIQILLGLIRLPSHVGICLDTCHAFQAGYDIRTSKEVANFAQIIQKTVGFESIYLIHCNDSKKPFMGKADRHEHIGKGFIGLEGFKAILHHPNFAKIPFILETPKDSPEADKTNLKTMFHLVNSHG